MFSLEVFDENRRGDPPSARAVCDLVLRRSRERLANQLGRSRRWLQGRCSFDRIRMRKTIRALAHSTEKLAR